MIEKNICNIIADLVTHVFLEFSFLFLPNSKNTDMQSVIPEKRRAFLHLEMEKLA